LVAFGLGPGILSAGPVTNDVTPYCGDYVSQTGIVWSGSARTPAGALAGGHIGWVASVGLSCRVGPAASKVGENPKAMTETKQLLLLRHAKSSWDDPSLADEDRPLAPRGRKAAKRLRAYVRRERIPLGLVLCSSAKRARETLDLVGPPGEIVIERELYRATAAELLERLRRVPDEVDAVMLIGHEPAIRDLAVGLVGRESELADRKFPTAGLARLTFTGPWSTLAPDGAGLAAFVRPTELT
jgi:phosphohistidine phosphatase